jgi:hypothetical protein
MKNMKNIFIIATFLLMGSVAIAQTQDKETKEVKVIKKTTESSSSRDHQENEIKNFRFGLVVMPSLNWYSTESKVIQRDGVVPKFGGGLAIEFRLAKVAALATGINIVTGGGKLKYNNGGQYNKSASTVSYYFDANDDIMEMEDVNAGTPSDYAHYQLNKRNYKTTYIAIPILLKLKTREIGSMVYYGQFGLNSYFRWKGRSTDDVSVLDAPSAGATEKKSDLIISRDVSIYNAALNFGLGTEWNLAGTTSMVLGVSYNLGFTNVLRKESKFLERRLNDANYDPMNPSTNNSYSVKPLEQVVKENSIVLSLGVLF